MKKTFLPTSAFMFFASVLFFFLLGVSLVTFWRQAKLYKHELIAEHVSKLQDIFTRINEECGIIDFEHEKNYIDFLTVKSFTGSEVGPMNLQHPEKWQGPYLQDNPTIQEQYYQIVHTDKGYFIVPGDGVALGDDKVIGKQIVINKKSDIAKMLDDGTLRVDGKDFAAKISVTG